MSNREQKIAIVGAGLAGLALADALSRRGRAREVVVFDRSDPATAQAPGAALHPLAGRSLAPKPGVFEAFDRAAVTLRRWRDELGASVLELPIVRPLLPGEAGERLARSFEDSRELFPEGFDIRRAPAAEFPLVSGAEEVITYAPAFSVDLRDALGRVREDLARRGVRFVSAEVEAIHREVEGWRLKGAGEGSFEAVLLATGDATPAWFDGLDLRRKAGELLVMEAPADARLDYLVGGLGHLAPLADGRWVGGSTFYRFEGSYMEADVSEADIRGRLERMVPAVARARTVEVWSGVRTVLHPTRAPVAGAVAGAPGVWLLGCLGPKGLLWSPILADAMAEALTTGAAELAPPEGAESAAGLRVKPTRVTLR